MTPMFELSDFYRYCRENDVDVIPHSGLPSAAMTVRDGTWYAVGFNFSRLGSLRQLRTAAMHETGHLRTGALHKVCSPYQLVAQAEYKADASSFRHYLPLEELRRAAALGYTEPWQLAEFFDLEESYIKKALHYWVECRGEKL